MKLTSFTDYTLRVLMYLALHRERLATIQGIANAFDISESHLTKVVHHLARSGVIESIRGKGGGIRLGQPAEQIRLGRIIREAEGSTAVVECLGPEGHCRITPDCRLAGVLHEAFERLYGFLDEHTLADLIDHPRPLRDLLGIAEPAI